MLCVGYLGEQIEAAVGARARSASRSRYTYDGPELAGTAGGARAALPLLGDASSCSTATPTCGSTTRDVAAAHAASGLPALMTVLRNVGAGSGNAATATGSSCATTSSADRRMRWIDYGLEASDAGRCAAPADEPDLAEVQRELARAGELAGYEASERFYEIGTPAALHETEAFLGTRRERQADRAVEGHARVPGVGSTRCRAAGTRGASSARISAGVLRCSLRTNQS